MELIAFARIYVCVCVSVVVWMEINIEGIGPTVERANQREHFDWLSCLYHKRVHLFTLW